MHGGDKPFGEVGTRGQHNATPRTGTSPEDPDRRTEPFNAVTHTWRAEAVVAADLGNRRSSARVQTLGRN